VKNAAFFEHDWLFAQFFCISNFIYRNENKRGNFEHSYFLLRTVPVIFIPYRYGIIYWVIVCSILSNFIYRNENKRDNFDHNYFLLSNCA
jgi:hypothetical protein